MSQQDTAQPNPFENPLVRHGIGVGGGLVAVFVAYFFLSGTVQLAVYGIALLDAIVTPQILKRATSSTDQPTDSKTESWND